MKGAPISGSIMALVALTTAAFALGCGASDPDQGGARQVASTPTNLGTAAPDRGIPRPLTPPLAEYGDMSVEQVRAFEAFPLYWLGEEFDGLPLESIERLSTPDALKPENSVTFFYGDCTPGPNDDGGCALPLTVRVEPYCYAQPQLIADEAKEASVQKLRGNADAQIIAGGLRIWTGDVSIRLAGNGSVDLFAAAESLASLNSEDGAVSDDLPAVDADCSEFELVDPHPISTPRT